MSDGRRRHGPRDGVTTATGDGPESETRDGAIERAETRSASALPGLRGPRRAAVVVNVMISYLTKNVSHT